MTQNETASKICEEVLFNKLASRHQIDVLRMYVEQAYAAGYDWGRAVERTSTRRANIIYL